MFIEGKKFKELRDAAKGGDERARKILHGYGNDEDVTMLIDEYFKPVEEVKPEVEVEGVDEEDLSPLEKFLRDNDVHEGDEDYDEYVEEFQKEFKEKTEDEPEVDCGYELNNKLDDGIKDEEEAINFYNELELYITNLLDIKDAEREGMLSQVRKIKQEEFEHIKILQDLMKK